MRVTSLVPDIQDAIQQSEQSLNTALQQLTTGKRVNQLSDDPAASANLVRSLSASANVDRYTANTSAVLGTLQTADSALSSVVTSLNQAITLGTQGANGSNNAANRQAVAIQVQGILANVVAQANTSFQGSYLFAGSTTQTQPFVVAPATGQYVYTGNSTVNSVQVGDSLNVQTNLPGDQVFTNGANVIGSLETLINALQTGTLAQIGAATTAITTALNYVGQQRVPLGSTVNQLNAQDNFLSQESLTLTTQQTSLVGVDIAKAATDLSQAEVQHSAVLAAAAKVLPLTLLDFLK